MTLPLLRPAGLLMAGLLMLSGTGCGGDKPPAQPATQDATASDDAHHHAHDHGATGPQGGHLIELEDGRYHAEWLHDDETGTVTVYILNEQIASDLNLEVTDVLITTQITGGETNEYVLTPSPAAQDEPPASCFEITDQGLLTALKVDTGVVCTLSATIDGQPVDGTIEHHAHGHHH